MKKRGIIDIGTNTAHILIGSIRTDGTLHVITKKRHYTFLGEDGLETISEKAIQRLSYALDDFKKIVDRYECEVHIIATEGLRSASNSATITEIFTKVYQWKYTIISGDQEAEYIHRGALKAIGQTNQPYLVMDIGGGSVEFILADQKNTLLQASYPIGISRLYERYHLQDPISFKEIDQMYEDLSEELHDLWDAVDRLGKTIRLVGCAGTFEVLLSKEQLSDITVSHKKVEVSHLLHLLDQVVYKSLDERKIVPDLPAERANYIVVALLLMNYVVKRLSISEITVSKYALKEGAVADDNLFLD